MSDTAPMTVARALSTWSDYRLRLKELGLVANSTLMNQLAICMRLKDALGTHPLDQLRKSHIEIYVGERRRTCAPVTIRGELNVLRQVLNWCVDEGHLIQKPRLPTVSVSQNETALPSDAAFAWVLATAPSGIALALEFMMLTGLSPHELERLQVRDAGLHGPDKGPIGFCLAIGQRPDFPVKQESRRRFVPLTGRAAAIWFQLAEGGHPLHQVFPRVDAMQKAVVRMRALAGKDSPAGADRITPKLMRKWFASHLASGGTPEHVLQRLMGHAPGSPITRRHYVRSNDAEVATAAASVSPLASTGAAS